MRLKQSARLIYFSLSLYTSCVVACQGLLIPEKELFKPAQAYSSNNKLILKKDPYHKMRDYFFWWLSLPTIGLEPHPHYSPVFYPFIPHFFSLDELAPQKGSGAHVALVDNGVAFQTFYDVTGTKPIACSHPYLARGVRSGTSFVSRNEYPSWHDYKELLFFYTDPLYQHQIESCFACYTKPSTGRSYLTQYLIQYGTADLRASSITLSKEGGKALDKLLSCFSTTALVYNKDTDTKIPLHLCALPDYAIHHRPVITYADQSWLYANHGTFCAGIIVGSHNNKSIGIAPAASLHALKSTQGSYTAYQNPKFLLNALQDICNRSIPIISLSYSMQTSAGYQSTLEHYFKKIPFSCVALGNTLVSNKTENYLATLSSITALIGSFGVLKNQNSYQYPISTFNGSVPDNPAFYVVMPGELMVSCCYNPCAQSNDILFVTMSGTSCATPLVAGFFALLVAECYPVLSYEQLKIIVHHAVVQLHDTSSWKQVHTIDMRMALFMGHVLKKISLVDTHFAKNYHLYVVSLRDYLFAIINSYGTQEGITVLFQEGMIDFLEKARKKHTDILYTHQNLTSLIEKVASDVHKTVARRTL